MPKGHAGPHKLTQDQIDHLKEVGNIGSGQAASRLSDLIQRRCFIDVPEVSYMDTGGVRALFGGGEALAVALHMRVMGDIPSVMVVVTLKSHALKMVEYMSRFQTRLPSKDLPFAGQLLLKELGEVHPALSALGRAGEGAGRCPFEGGPFRLTPDIRR